MPPSKKPPRPFTGRSGRTMNIPTDEDLEFPDLNDVLQIDYIWTILLDQGPLPLDEAIKRVAAELKAKNLASYKRLRKESVLWRTIDQLIKHAIRIGDIDRPKRGYVRAVFDDPEACESDE